MNKTIFLAALTLFLTGCIKDPGPVVIKTPAGFNVPGSRGVFLLNEGNFNKGNGSLSFYSYDSLKIFNHIFQSVNNRYLGDIPFSIGIIGAKAYIVVNNSAKIEVIDLNDLKSVATINGLISPRKISFVSENKAYITSLYSDSVAILDTSTDKITGYINIRHPSEAILTVSEITYVAHWTGGNKVFVIDNATDLVTDSVEVGLEPETMVADRNNRLWILCNGGWARRDFAELWCINTPDNTLEKRFVFPSLNDSPLCLKINGSGETLFFLHQGVRRMNISDEMLPDQPIIPESDHLFYRMAVNPENGDIFVTDAVDYQQKGYLLRYDKDGVPVSENQAGIIPGDMYFKNSTVKRGN